MLELRCHIYCMQYNEKSRNYGPRPTPLYEKQSIQDIVKIVRNKTPMHSPECTAIEISQELEYNPYHQADKDRK